MRKRTDLIIVGIVLVVIALVIAISIASKKQRIGRRASRDVALVGQSLRATKPYPRIQDSQKRQAKEPQLPRYPVPILLGKKQDEIVRQIGGPDDTRKISRQIGGSWWEKWGNGKVLMCNNLVTLCWEYKNQPYNGYTMILEYDPVNSRDAVFGGTTYPSFANVRVHNANIYTGNLRGMPLAKQVVPDFLLGLAPTAYFVKHAVVYDSRNQLAVIWRYQGNTYMAIVSSESEKFTTERRSVNTTTGDVSHHFSPNSNTHNWRNFMLTGFYQVVGSPSYKKLFDRGDAMSGFVQLK